MICAGDFARQIRVKVWLARYKLVQLKRLGGLVLLPRRLFVCEPASTGWLVERPPSVTGGLALGGVLNGICDMSFKTYHHLHILVVFHDVAVHNGIFSVHGSC